MIRYVTGDATDPMRPVGQHAIVAHIANDQGAWGAGFVLAISRKWPEPERCYRDLFRNRRVLGDVQFCHTMGDVNGEATVANMIAQHGFPSKDRPCAVDFRALEECLCKVATAAVDEYQASVHMPRIGCGIGGATWDQIEPIIERTLCAHGVEVTVYDLPKGIQ